MDFVSKRIRHMVPYKAGEQVEYIVKLNTNENPYPPTPKIEERLKSLDIDKLKLYPDQNSNMLKTAIAEKFGIINDMVFVGNGSDEILALIRPAYFDGVKEKIAYPDITYSFYPVYDELFKNKTVIKPVKEDFTIDLKDYDDLDVKGFMFANPNAPTSIAIPKTVMEDFVSRHPDKIVIIDEAYIDFCCESMAELTKKYDNLLVIQTFSKGYSLAGIRCGYAIGSSSLIDGLEIIKDSFNNYPLDYIAEIIATEAIKDEQYYRNINQKVVATRERIIKKMREMDFTVMNSSSNFIFVTHKTKYAGDLYRQLKERKILVRHWKKDRIDNYLRITIGCDSDMDYFIDKLSELL